MFGDVPPFDH